MTLSVAIIGAGRMGRAHANHLAPMDDARIVGVSDVVPASADGLAADTGAKAFTDHLQMLDSTRPDVVYICTPAGDHLAQIRDAAERGAAIFVEKPLAPNVHDAFAAADVVERHGVLCSAGYQWRYSPVADAAADALGDEPVALLSGWWYWTIPLVEWIKDKGLGGGQIFDQATHLIDLMRYLAGDIATVHANYGSNAVPSTELPNWDANAVNLSFTRGAVGSLQTTYALFPGIDESNGLDVVARELLIRIELGGVRIFRPNRDPVEVKPPDGWNIDGAFMDAVRRNDPTALRANARESAKSVAVSLAANYSAVTGNVVDMESFVADPPKDAEIMPTGRPTAG